jgi:hypothetical protein
MKDVLKLLAFIGFVLLLMQLLGIDAVTINPLTAEGFLKNLALITILLPVMLLWERSDTAAVQ